MKEMAEDSRGQDRGLDALDASERQKRTILPRTLFTIFFFLS